MFIPVQLLSQYSLGIATNLPRSGDHLQKQEVWPRDVPDAVRSIPYYWELSLERLDRIFG
ncbi:hypothetical protein [Bacteroides nordii]|uniref:hypothetical protein n=1 Tax=Bacteroides nordii TaxID=291645 RepID=UPI002A81C389|nr:hypothetical protein [Bacteroides nordii]